MHNSEKSERGNENIKLLQNSRDIAKKGVVHDWTYLIVLCDKREKKNNNKKRGTEWTKIFKYKLPHLWYSEKSGNDGWKVSAI